MLFNTYAFVFAFLPVALAGYWTLCRIAPQRAALVWLVACSLFFYGFWNPIYLLLIFTSIGFNFSVGYFLGRSPADTSRRKLLLTVGVVGNLGLLGYFKYANFFVDSANYLFEANFVFDKVILPLAISFFTFQQIAYLADSYKGLVVERNFLDYCLFVTFFPQLIAGPIVHHSKMMPQFRDPSIAKFDAAKFAGGITIFFIGMAKKVVLADALAEHVDTIFRHADYGGTLGFVDGWIGTLAFGFQVYFDFSGYSDMAIGLALLFGIRLPQNFNSPFKSITASDMWQRWHCTLGAFMRDYLYIPLGGNRVSSARQYFNLMLTMTLGGLWHGAHWTFVVWGAQQGAMLCVFRWWSGVRGKLGLKDVATSRLRIAVACFITCFSWFMGMALFRGETWDGAMRIYAAMFGGYGFSLDSIIDAEEAWRLVVACFVIVWALPNTQQFMRRVQPVVDWDKVAKTLYPTMRWMDRFYWQPRLVYAVAGAILAAYSIVMMNRVQEFLYFQF